MRLRVYYTPKRQAPSNNLNKCYCFVISYRKENFVWKRGTPMTIRLKPLAVSVAVPLAGGLLSNWLSGDVRAVYRIAQSARLRAARMDIRGCVAAALPAAGDLRPISYGRSPPPPRARRRSPFTACSSSSISSGARSSSGFGLFRFAFWELWRPFRARRGHRDLLRDALPAHTLAHGALSLLAALCGGSSTGRSRR